MFLGENARLEFDIRQKACTLFLYSITMDYWARMRSGISSTEQVLQANIHNLRNQLLTDPNCNKESILEALAMLEAALLALDEAPNSPKGLRD